MKVGAQPVFRTQTWTPPDGTIYNFIHLGS